MPNNTPHLSINRTPLGDICAELKLAGYFESRVYRHRDGSAVVEYVNARGDKLLVLHGTKSDATVFRPEMMSIEPPVMTADEFLGRTPQVQPQFDDEAMFVQSIEEMFADPRLQYKLDCKERSGEQR